jgi:hypothetical protein
MVFKSKPFSSKKALRVDNINARGSPELMPRKNIIAKLFKDFDSDIIIILDFKF